MSRLRVGLALMCAPIFLSGCGQARLGNGQPCVPTNALGAVIWNAPDYRNDRVETVTPGSTVTIQLIEPEGYASAPSPQLIPKVFMYSAPKASDPRVLQPIAVCPFPGYTTTADETFTAFTAVGPGRAVISAPIDPRYPIPPPEPGLAIPHGFRVTIVVTPWWVLGLIRIGLGLLALLLLAGVVFTWRWFRGYRPSEELVRSSGGVRSSR
jgi:hypothetical protein